MLDTLDLTLEINEKKFKKMLSERTDKLGELQRALREAKIPSLIVFEGWHGSGKGVIINSLVQAMDPRGFKVHTAYYPNEEERNKPFFWQFWEKMPPKGAIAIFDRSWYGQTVGKIVAGELKPAQIPSAYSDINAFEGLLSDDDYIIIKIFIHISKAEHAKRIKKLEKTFVEELRQTSEDWKEIDTYDKYYAAYEEMFSKTDTAAAPWLAVEAQDSNYARIKVIDYIINTFEKKLAAIKFKKQIQAKAAELLGAGGQDKPVEAVDKTFFYSVLGKVDLGKSAGKEEYNQLLLEYQSEARKLQLRLFKEKVSTILVFEGWDAAGKGGAIRRLTASLDPRGYYVVPISAPGLVDKNYHYLWRFWQEMPAKGWLAIFDRSWYGRVMVERVEGFATEEEWRRAYREINEMEEQLLNSGAVLVKFWLQIDQDEQLKRFAERQNDPYKTWKITEEDWRNREKWGEYEIAVNEMLFRTSTTRAPWTIVESNDKRYARLKVLKTTLEAMKSKL